MAKKVSLMPGLENPESAKMLDKHLDARNHADYRCYMFLRDCIDSNEELDREEARKLLAKREEENDKFTRAVSGKPVD